LNIKIIRKNLRPIKKLYFDVIFLFSKLVFLLIPNLILDHALEREIYCKFKKIKFSIRNFSDICRFRAKTFSYKEPDTLEWIDGFETDSTLIDIGANVGIYSLYASYKINKIYAFEPDALNFSLLNLNIFDNNKDKVIKAYPISIHSYKTFVLNLPCYN